MQTNDICTSHESQSAWDKPKVCRTWTDDLVLGAIPLAITVLVFLVAVAKGR
jgi:hypothetical protein